MGTAARFHGRPRLQKLLMPLFSAGKFLYPILDRLVLLGIITDIDRRLSQLDQRLLIFKGDLVRFDQACDAD